MILEFLLDGINQKIYFWTTLKATSSEWDY